MVLEWHYLWCYMLVVVYLWGGRTSYLFVLSRGAAISATAYIGTFVVTFGGGGFVQRSKVL